MKIVKGLYTRFVETFQKDCQFIQVRSSEGFPTDKPYEYFLNDLFNGDVYLLKKGDTMTESRNELFRSQWPWVGKGKKEEEEDEQEENEQEYITDEDLEIEI